MNNTPRQQTPQYGSPHNPYGGPQAPYQIPPQPGYVPNYVPQPRSGPSKAALYLALGSFLFPPLGIAAIILAFQARAVIKRTGAPGRGKTTVAITLSVVTLIAGFVLTIWSIANSPVDRDGPVAIGSARAGQCLETLPDLKNEFENYAVTPCDKRHVGEILHVGNSSSYSPWLSSAIATCREKAPDPAETIDALGPEKFSYTFTETSSLSRRVSDKTHCIISVKSGKIEGSLRDGTAQLVP